MKETSVYVELDCLFDTRIATLASIDEDLAKEVLESDWYFTRLNDRLWDYDDRIDQDEFLSRWNNRNEDILFTSAQTQVVERLRGQVAELISYFSQGQDEAATHLTINTFPYNQALIEKILRDPISKMTMFDEINFVSLGIDFQKPTFLKRYGTILIYDLDKWLHVHHEELGKNSMYDTIFPCPLILKEIPDRLTDIPKIVAEMQDTFAGVMKYQPQELRVYSLHIPNKK